MSTDFFSSDGHLTDYAIKQITTGDATQLQRLEVAEHISFCNVCLEKHINAFTADSFTEPQIDITKSVMQKIKAKMRRFMLSKVTTYVAAASIALVLWGTGVYDVLGELPGQISSYADTLQKQPGFFQSQKDDESSGDLNEKATTFERIGDFIFSFGGED